jgi:adenosylhomocysteine nucleosidase
MTEPTPQQDEEQQDDVPTIAVLGAMDEEIRLLAGLLEDVDTHHEAGLDITLGTIVSNRGARLRIVATVAGMGTVAAGAATQFLITRYSPRAVIFSGIAGNLTNRLGVNDVILAGTLRYMDSDMRLISQAAPGLSEYHSDPDLIRMAEQALDEQSVQYMVGTVATGNIFVDDDAKRERAREQTHADCVEMEGAAVVHIAAKNGVPALVIRALSDNTDTSYDQFHHFDISEYADTASRLVVAICKRM